MDIGKAPYAAFSFKRQACNTGSVYPAGCSWCFNNRLHAGWYVTPYQLPTKGGELDGNAAAASAAKGEAVLSAAGRALAGLLSEIHALPEDTLKSRP